MDDLFFLEAKCSNTHNTFYIRFDKAAGGTWCQTYGVKAVPYNANGSSTYNKMQIDISETDIGPQYRCPYCGNESYVRCGRCGNITCKPTGVKTFTCAHCGNSGTIGGVITKIDGKSGIGQA